MNYELQITNYKFKKSEVMKMVLNLICINLLIMFHQDKYAMENSDAALTMSVSVNVSSVVAVQERRRVPVTRENKNSIKYPNPFSSSTIILRNISTAGYVTINLYGLLGCEVCGYEEGIKNIGVSMKKIDLSFLNSGVCFMKSELIEGDRHSADLGFRDEVGILNKK